MELMGRMEEYYTELEPTARLKLFEIDACFQSLRYFADGNLANTLAHKVRVYVFVEFFCSFVTKVVRQI